MVQITLFPAGNMHRTHCSQSFFFHGLKPVATILAEATPLIDGKQTFYPGKVFSLSTCKYAGACPPTVIKSRLFLKLQQYYPKYRIKFILQYNYQTQ